MNDFLLLTVGVVSVTLKVSLAGLNVTYRCGDKKVIPSFCVEKPNDTIPSMYDSDLSGVWLLGNCVEFEESWYPTYWYSKNKHLRLSPTRSSPIVAPHYRVTYHRVDDIPTNAGIYVHCDNDKADIRKLVSKPPFILINKFFTDYTYYDFNQSDLGYSITINKGKISNCEWQKHANICIVFKQNVNTSKDDDYRYNYSQSTLQLNSVQNSVTGEYKLVKFDKLYKMPFYDSKQFTLSYKTLQIKNDTKNGSKITKFLAWVIESKPSIVANRQIFYYCQSVYVTDCNHKWKWAHTDKKTTNFIENPNLIVDDCNVIKKQS